VPLSKNPVIVCNVSKTTHFLMLMKVLLKNLTQTTSLT
jgi:hypothetical protein